MKKFIFIPLLLATMFFGTQTAYSQKAYRTRSVFEGKNKSNDIYFNALYPIGVEATPEM